MSLKLFRAIGTRYLLTGILANEITTKGVIVAEAEIGTLVANDKFVVVEGLNPETLIELKFLMELQ